MLKRPKYPLLLLLRRDRSDHPPTPFSLGKHRGTLEEEEQKKKGGRQREREAQRGMREISEMVPQQWQSPCGSQCVHKFAALTQIPWRVFCKKGCGADGDTMEECVDACDHLCYKDPVFKDQQWSAYIDRSPGAASYSEECFHACVSGCGFKFDVPAKEVEEVHPNRPTTPLAAEKPPANNQVVQPQTPSDDDMPSTSA